MALRNGTFFGIISCCIVLLLSSEFVRPEVMRLLAAFPNRFRKHWRSLLRSAPEIHDDGGGNDGVWSDKYIGGGGSGGCTFYHDSRASTMHRRCCPHSRLRLLAVIRRSRVLILAPAFSLNIADCSHIYACSLSCLISYSSL